MSRLLRLALPIVSLFSLVTAQNSTCYWPDGSASSELAACSTDGGDTFCCPVNGADDLYPFSYPNCTPNGMCQAGNSNFLARGGCTDPTFKSPGCPQVCLSSLTNSSGMAGITNCGAKTYNWLCCNNEHDAGLCECDPPSGSAFSFAGGLKPVYASDLAGGSTTTSSTSSSSSTPTATPSSTEIDTTTTTVTTADVTTTITETSTETPSTTTTTTTTTPSVSSGDSTPITPSTTYGFPETSTDTVSSGVGGGSGPVTVTQYTTLSQETPSSTAASGSGDGAGSQTSGTTAAVSTGAAAIVRGSPSGGMGTMVGAVLAWLMLL